MKTILITGAASGLGQTTAVHLAQRGYRVFASMRDLHTRNQTSADFYRQLAQAQQLQLTPIELDICSESSIQAALQQIYQQVESLDVIIQNAGLGALGFIESFSEQQAQQVFEVNALGPLRLTNAVLPYLRRQSDSLIIYLSSAAGRLCFPFLGLYNASKFALEALVESYSYELAGFNIDLSLIEPGAYPSDLHNKRLQPENNDCLVHYGALQQAPDAMVAAMMHLMGASDAPNPIEISQAIEALIQQPQGQRPLRQVVGKIATTSIAELNQFSSQCQQQLLGSMGG